LIICEASNFLTKKFCPKKLPLPHNLSSASFAVLYCEPCSSRAKALDLLQLCSPGNQNYAKIRRQPGTNKNRVNFTLNKTNKLRLCSLNKQIATGHLLTNRLHKHVKVLTQNHTSTEQPERFSEITKISFINATFLGCANAAYSQTTNYVEILHTQKMTQNGQKLE
jgi:hypothetical protein